MGKGYNEAKSYTRFVGFDLRQAYGTTGNANGKIEYVGYADPGTADSTTEWQIFKLAYDSSGRLTHRRYAKLTTEKVASDEFNKSWSLKANYNYSGI